MSSVPTWEALKKENQLRAQRKRVAVGKEEQGSGRMTSFCHRHKKTSEQSGLCSDVGCVDKKDTRGCNKSESKPSAMGRSWRGGTTERVIDGV